jgi:D-alanyl-D-alanine carboxypeptidase
LKNPDIFDILLSITVKPGYAILFSFLLFTCAGREISPQSDRVSSGPARSASSNAVEASLNRDREKISRVLAAAGIPAEMVRHIEEDSRSFLSSLEGILQNGDPYLRMLVDKQHALPEGYEADDLIELRYQSYRAGITDVMMLRAKAETALEEMAAAAKAEGISLTVSSAYRSYQYQIGSFDRWTARLGLTEAERVSARPGKSQHQLGLVVDFGSITNEFADTAAGKWVKANASRFGWSISFPRGYEALTGYAWESWHYRYVGRDLASFIDTWFDGIQQYALYFIHEWEHS